MTSTLDRPARRGRTATIADIAEQAGVSVPTVSKVINGRSDVSPGTRQRVEEAIRAVGYQRANRAQRAAPIIELIFHELESEWALEIVRGVERIAGTNHLAVVLTEMQGRRTPGRGWIEGVAVAASRSSSSTRPVSPFMTRRRSGRPTGAAG
jgi:hypothetical protein